MDAIEQAERTALRASDECAVLTLRESRALVDFLNGMGLDQLPADEESDLARAYRMLVNQTGWFEAQRQDGPDE